MNMSVDRDYLQSKIRQLIAKPWTSDNDLLAIYTILLAIPLSGGMVSTLITELSSMIDSDIKTLFTEDSNGTKSPKPSPK